MEVYVFWNIHEPTYAFDGNHKYNWEGRANLTGLLPSHTFPLFFFPTLFLEKTHPLSFAPIGFLDACARNGLFVDFRIGPYVCAEWDWGGVPLWLLHADGIVYRSSNSIWEKYMETWMADLMEEVTPWLSKNGGPIIMAQVEKGLIMFFSSLLSPNKKK